MTAQQRNFTKADDSPLDVFFRPNSVALIGATERDGSVGRALLQNLQRAGFAGGLYPVNPRHTTDGTAGVCLD
jgi:acyl-CoA synthetase (NDP forming)